MKNKLLLIILLLALVALGAVFFLQPEAQRASYSSFSASLENQEVEEVELKKTTIIYRLKAQKDYLTTDNPLSPDLKERLLLQGIKVKDNQDDILSYVMDMAFNVFFFGLIGFGLFKLLQAYNKTYRVVRKTKVGFDDIAGMDNLKKEFMFLVDVLKNPSQYNQKGIRPTKGVILEGLPGNGKTLFAKALATQAHVNFIATKGADFQSAFMSMGAMKIRLLFAKARRNKPCIIFIDEFDSIGERRNYAGTGIDKENNRIITTTLNEMDGFSSNDGILVIAATNSYASLDPALIRPGRFDLKFNITNPDSDTRMKLIDLYTKTKVLDSSLDKAGLSLSFEGLSCAAIEAILNEASLIANMNHRPSIRLEDISQGAMKTGSKLRLRR